MTQEPSIRSNVLKRLVATLDEWPEWQGHCHAYPKGEQFHWIKGLGANDYCAARANAGGDPIHKHEWESARGMEVCG